uniref:Uncharacterized protein n=1 Tax=Arundo donax TaxID=35708 RepID=A0A0A8YAR2_ARUDO
MLQSTVELTVPFIQCTDIKVYKQRDLSDYLKYGCYNVWTR